MPPGTARSLHDALPICAQCRRDLADGAPGQRGDVDALRPADPGQVAFRLTAQLGTAVVVDQVPLVDRKSTRLNSRHTVISYAVFCLKKKIGRRGRALPR